MRPSAAPESDHGDGAPARDWGAARPSGALTQVPSTAPNPHQIPPRAPRYARAPLALRPAPAAALVQPGRACAEPADRPVQARAGRTLPVQARAGTGASGADATSLVGISCQLFSSHAVNRCAPTSTSLPCPPCPRCTGVAG